MLRADQPGSLRLKGEFGSLPDRVHPIRRRIREDGTLARRPIDHDLVDALGISQAEVHALRT